MAPRLWNQTLITVRDVPASSAWYQAVLDGSSGHGGTSFDQLVVDGEIVLQLHAMDVADQHGPLADPQVALGNGVVLWFEVADLTGAAQRIQELSGEQPQLHENPNARQQEIWLTDPDGYRVVIAGPSGWRPR